MKKYKLKLDVYELKIIINSLNEFRNKLIRENENTDVIDELLSKYIEMLLNLIRMEKNHSKKQEKILYNRKLKLKNLKISKRLKDQQKILLKLVNQL